MIISKKNMESKSNMGGLVRRIKQVLPPPRRAFFAKNILAWGTHLSAAKTITRTNILLSLEAAQYASTQDILGYILVETKSKPASDENNKEIQSMERIKRIH